MEGVRASLHGQMGTRPRGGELPMGPAGPARGQGAQHWTALQEGRRRPTVLQAGQGARTPSPCSLRLMRARRRMGSTSGHRSFPTDSEAATRAFCRCYSWFNAG